MSDLSPAQKHVLEEAERINAERMQVVDDLARAVAARVDLEHELAEAKKHEKRLMSEAEKKGWTRAQVSKFAKVPKSTTKTNTASSEPAQQGVEAETSQEV